MANLQPISVERHGDKAWLEARNYAFAACDTVCLLSLRELPKAIMGLPTGFITTGDNYRLVAIQGFQPDQNLLVAADGSWQSNHLPEAYRYYPFTIASLEDEPEKQVLCINEDSNLIVSKGGEVEAGRKQHALIDSEGKLTNEVEHIRQFLAQSAASKAAADQVASILAEYELITPWPIVITIDQLYPDHFALYTNPVNQESPKLIPSQPNNPATKSPLSYIPTSPPNQTKRKPSAYCKTPTHKKSQPR